MNKFALPNKRKAIFSILFFFLCAAVSLAQESHRIQEMPASVFKKVAPTIARIICGSDNEYGTGSIIAFSPKNNAYILTACHVVARNFDMAKKDVNLKLSFHSDIRVQIGEDTTKFYKAIPIRSCADIENDLLLLATECIPSKLLISYEKSTKIKPGQKVAAFGYPGTNSPVQLVGNIEQKLAKYFILQQNLKKGLSGGPLVDKYGRMIGMALFIKGRKKGYALHTDLILPIVNGWLEQLSSNRNKFGSYIAKQWKRQKYGKFWHRFFKQPIFIASEAILAGVIIYCKFKNNKEKPKDLPGPPSFPNQ